MRILCAIAVTTLASSSLGATRLAFGWVNALRSHIDACWQRPKGVTTNDAIEVQISFELNSDGSLARGPTLIEASPHRLGPAFADSAIAAIKRCQPYSFLPADEYTGGWDKLDMIFSTDAATRAPSRLKSSPTFHFDAKEVRKTLEQRLKERDTKGGTQ